MKLLPLLIVFHDIINIWKTVYCLHGHNNKQDTDDDGAERFEERKDHGAINKHTHPHNYSYQSSTLYFT